MVEDKNSFLLVPYIANRTSKVAKLVFSDFFFIGIFNVNVPNLLNVPNLIPRSGMRDARIDFFYRNVSCECT